MPDTYLEEAVEKLIPDPAEGVMTDAEKATYAALVRQAVGDLCWGAFRYRCERCGFDWWVWMSLGVEGPGELKERGLYVACPFMIRCPAWPQMKPCDGEMQHINWSEDRTFDSPVVPPDDVPRFVLPLSGHDAGHLHIPTPALVEARRALNEEENRRQGRRPPGRIDNEPSA